MLRAGPFSDQDIVALLNRRFVSFYFDLSTRGAAGDAAARKAVLAVRPRLGRSSVGTPKVLLMSPDGEVLAEIDNYASEKVVLAALLDVLKQHPEYAVPAKGEDQGTPLERARVLADLQEHDKAMKLLAQQDAGAARLLHAQLLRKHGESKAAAVLLSRIEDASLVSDIRMERALLLWQAGEHADLAELLKDFPADHPRKTEACYYHGLAVFHGGDVAAAKAAWKDMIANCAQDRWVYRADWAYSQAGKQKRGTVMMSGGGKKSPLGRIGYMGRRNPDLARR